MKFNDMDKSLQMQYYNKLRQTNHTLAKTKHGNKIIMREALFSAKVIPILDYANNITIAFQNIFKSFKHIL